jgi:hypothetical protein
MGGFIQEQVSTPLVGTISAIGENNTGDLFACSENNGQLYRVCPDEPPVVAMDSLGLLVSTPAVSYEWYYNGNLLPDTTQSIDPMNNGGGYYVVAVIGAGCTFQSNTVQVSGAGVGTIAESEGVLLYPNPADSFILLNLGSSFEGEEVIVEIMDMSGKLIRRIDQAKTVVRIQTGELLNGQYHLTVSSSGEMKALRSFVVAH